MQKDPWGLLASQSRQIGEIQATETLSQKTKMKKKERKTYKQTTKVDGS